MIRALILSAAAAVVVVILAFSAAEPVEACTYTAEFDPVGSSDLIVAGRATGWEPVPDVDLGVGADPVRINVEVDDTLRGLSRSDVNIVEFTRLETNPDYKWGLSDCSAFGSDPTGKYYIVGLIWNGDYYTSSAGMMFFQGEQPSGEDYEAAIARIEGLSSANDGESPAVVGLVLVVLVAGLVACTVAWFAVRRSSRS